MSKYKAVRTVFILWVNMNVYVVAEKLTGEKASYMYVCIFKVNHPGAQRTWMA